MQMHEGNDYLTRIRNKKKKGFLKIEMSNNQVPASN